MLRLVDHLVLLPTLLLRQVFHVLLELIKVLPVLGNLGPQLGKPG